jgi:hypothetical protein
MLNMFPSDDDFEDEDFDPSEYALGEAIYW